MSSSIQPFFPSITKKEYEAAREKEASESFKLQRDVLTQKDVSIKEELKVYARRKKTLV